jgi:SAM-dependent methyltransferase
MPATFDEFSQNYTDKLDRDLHITGDNSAEFARIKVERMLDAVQRRLGGNLADLSCLDVGCGNGIASQFLRGRLRRVAGVDVSEGMLADGRARYPDVEFTAYDGQRLPYADGEFDVTFAYCVLHHVPPPQMAAFVADMKRVTSPRGLVFIFEHNPINPMTMYIVNRCPYDRDAHLLRMGQTTRFFERAGLDVIERAYYLFFPGPLKVLRPLERWLSWLPLGGQYYVAGRGAEPATA